MSEENEVEEVLDDQAEVMEVAEESGEDSACDPVEPDTMPDEVVELDDPQPTAAEAEEQRKADCRSTAAVNARAKHKRLRG